MTTRCKMICQSTAVSMGSRKNEEGAYEQGELYAATLTAVYDDTCEENRKFFASTPNARLELQVVAKQHFEVGQSYYIDITPVPA